MKKIYIDAGHGGDSIGASYKGRLEQDDCLRLALAVGKLVEAQGIDVKYSRKTNVNPDLTARCKEANAWGADYFISIHRNAFEPEQADGVEAWVYSGCKVNGPTWTDALRIVNNVAAAVGFRNRGVRAGAPAYQDFAVNRITTMDSCLLECGFIDSTKDNRLFDDKFDAMAVAIAKGLCEAVGATYTDTVPPVTTPDTPTTDKVWYVVQAGAFRDKKNAENRVKDLKKAGFDAIIKEMSV